MNQLITFILPLMVMFIGSLVGKPLDSYTSWNGLLLLCALLLRVHTLMPYLFVSYIGINISFHSSILFKRDVFGLMAKELGMSMKKAFVYDIIMHILPLCITYWYCISLGLFPLKWYHGILVCLYHLSWSYVMCDGLCLDEVYIPLPWEMWKVMWVIAVGTELGVCFLF